MPRHVRTRGTFLRRSRAQSDQAPTRPRGEVGVGSPKSSSASSSSSSLEPPSKSFRYASRSPAAGAMAGGSSSSSSSALPDTRLDEHHSASSSSCLERNAASAAAAPAGSRLTSRYCGPRTALKRAERPLFPRPSARLSSPATSRDTETDLPAFAALCAPTRTRHRRRRRASALASGGAHTAKYASRLGRGHRAGHSWSRRTSVAGRSRAPGARASRAKGSRASPETSSFACVFWVRGVRARRHGRLGRRQPRRRSFVPERNLFFIQRKRREGPPWSGPGGTPPGPRPPRTPSAWTVASARARRRPLPRGARCLRSLARRRPRRCAAMSARAFSTVANVSEPGNSSACS